MRHEELTSTSRLVTRVGLASGGLFCALQAYLLLVPIEVRVGNAALDVRAYPLMPSTLRVSDIREVSLLTEAPRVVERVNGFALGKRLRGTFELEGLGPVVVAANLGDPPFVLVRGSGAWKTWGGHPAQVLVQLEDERATRELADELQLSIDPLRGSMP